MIAARLGGHRWPGTYIWAPIPDDSTHGGHRHVFLGRQQDYWEGGEYATLCLEVVTFTEHGDWLRWPSCLKCWESAKQFHENVHRPTSPP